MFLFCESQSTHEGVTTEDVQKGTRQTVPPQEAAVIQHLNESDDLI